MLLHRIFDRVPAAVLLQLQLDDLLQVTDGD